MPIVVMQRRCERTCACPGRTPWQLIAWGPMRYTITFIYLKIFLLSVEVVFIWDAQCHIFIMSTYFTRTIGHVIISLGYSRNFTGPTLPSRRYESDKFPAVLRSTSQLIFRKPFQLGICFIKLSQFSSFFHDNST